MEARNIARQIAAQSRLTQDQAEKWLTTFVELVSQRGPQHRIRTRSHPAWKAHDPRSGAEISVMQKQHLHIKLRKPKRPLNHGDSRSERN